MKPRVIIYCDGACSPNPGIGGWGALLISEDGLRRELSGAVQEATNNRMELLGAIMALRSLEHPCDVTLHTDSKYVQGGFTQGWLAKWQRNGWLTSAKKPVLNQDLWSELVELIAIHQVEWKWVPGHADCEGNNRCEELAVAARTELSVRELG